MKALSRGRPERKNFRKALLFGSAMLFPMTMLYFSPGMVFRGARLGILSGSYLTFAALFLSALVAGRAWCGFFCPGGGLCEMARAVNDDPFRRGGLKAVKYVVWILWLAGIALVVVFVGHGFHEIDPLLGTARGVSIHSLELWPFYYFVIGIILSLSLFLGRRGFCHTLCWMAPFMVLGRCLRNVMRTPALQLAVDPEGCSDCGDCRKVCPMSLPVPEIVRTGSFEHRDCILCGECVRACPKGCIRLNFGRPSAGCAAPGMNRGER